MSQEIDQTGGGLPRLGIMLGAQSDAEADEFEQLAASTLALLVEPISPRPEIRAALLARIRDEGKPSATFLDGRATVSVEASAVARTAVLTLHGLPPAPEGKEYQVWFIRAGRFSSKAKPLGAGLFTAETGVTEVRVARRYRKHDVVAVTLEPAGGSRRPTSDPLFAVET